MAQTSEQFRQDLLSVVETGAALLKHMGVESSLQVPSLAEVTTIQEAQVAGVLAAVKALNVHIGRLCGSPMQSPTPAQAEQGLAALRQQRDIQTAFGTAFSRAITDFCVQLEAVLDEQDLREKDVNTQTKEL